MYQMQEQKTTNSKKNVSNDKNKSEPPIIKPVVDWKAIVFGKSTSDVKSDTDSNGSDDDSNKLEFNIKSDSDSESSNSNKSNSNKSNSNKSNSNKSNSNKSDSNKSGF